MDKINYFGQDFYKINDNPSEMDEFYKFVKQRGINDDYSKVNIWKSDEYVYTKSPAYCGSTNNQIGNVYSKIKYIFCAGEEKHPSIDNFDCINNNIHLTNTHGFAGYNIFNYKNWDLSSKNEFDEALSKIDIPDQVKLFGRTFYSRDTSSMYIDENIEEKLYFYSTSIVEKYHSDIRTRIAWIARIENAIKNPKFTDEEITDFKEMLISEKKEYEKFKSDFDYFVKEVKSICKDKDGKIYISTCMYTFDIDDVKYFGTKEEIYEKSINIVKKALLLI